MEPKNPDYKNFINRWAQIDRGYFFNEDLHQVIWGVDVDEVLYNTSKELLNASEQSPRGQKTKELLQTTMVITEPRNCVIVNPARKLSKEYLKAELNWYLNGSQTIDMIKRHTSMWEKIAENGKVNSNYGYFVFKEDIPNFQGSQFDWIIYSLKKDKDSRQAIINFNNIHHKKHDIKDFVCTISTQYLIRNDELIGITNMRSNDLIYGFSYDFPWFSYLQQKICSKLKDKYPDLKLGRNIHTAGSLHVYEKHYKMLENIIKEYDQKEIISKTLKEINLTSV